MECACTLYVNPLVTIDYTCTCMLSHWLLWSIHVHVHIHFCACMSIGCCVESLECTCTCTCKFQVWSVWFSSSSDHWHFTHTHTHTHIHTHTHTACRIPPALSWGIIMYNTWIILHIVLIFCSPKRRQHEEI